MHYSRDLFMFKVASIVHPALAGAYTQALFNRYVNRPILTSSP